MTPRRSPQAERPSFLRRRSRRRFFRRFVAKDKAKQTKQGSADAGKPSGGCSPTRKLGAGDSGAAKRRHEARRARPQPPADPEGKASAARFRGLPACRQAGRAVARRERVPRERDRCEGHLVFFSPCWWVCRLRRLLFTGGLFLNLIHWQQLPHGFSRLKWRFSLIYQGFFV